MLLIPTRAPPSRKVVSEIIGVLLELLWKDEEARTEESQDSEGARDLAQEHPESPRKAEASQSMGSDPTTKVPEVKTDGDQGGSIPPGASAGSTFAAPQPPETPGSSHSRTRCEQVYMQHTFYALRIRDQKAFSTLRQAHDIALRKRQHCRVR